MLLHTYICVSQPMCRERFRKNYLEPSNIALFTREICNIWSEDRFHLARTGLGKEIY